MNVKEIYPARVPKFESAACIIVVSLEEAKGNLIPQNPKMRVIAGKQQHRLMVVEVDYFNGPRIELIYYGIHSRDGWSDYLFRAEVEFRTWGKGSRTLEHEELAALASQARRDGILPYPTVTQGEDAVKATRSAQQAGLIAV